MEVVYIFWIGVAATIFMDLSSVALKFWFGVQSLDYSLVGRWLLSMPKGFFCHRNIINSARLTHEKWVGWLAHYMIGVGFAGLYYLAIPSEQQPLFFCALGFGLFTVLIPFFIMQPCFGFGIAARRVPSAWQARLKSVFAHGVFGIGLYLAIHLFNNVV
ncbi:DUF2938 family protein [uncultured Acinetobacter sp.]|uniref:DUF2938 family protein n=1 Tax=uncultured Acinetobacter sp. TaxID=165433 RepID=UPI002585F4AA|nr:DUF2938 family protein [uncultured Acinetobacter sp.]